MSNIFLTNIDLKKNELQNVVVHKLATAPTTPKDGQIYFNTGDERYYIKQSTGWKDVTGRLDDILAGTGSTCLVVTDNGDGTLEINISEATGSIKGAMSAADKTKLDASTNLGTVSTLVERDASGDFTANDITANKVTGLVAPTAGSDATNKTYVDNLVSSGMRIVGNIDCSTNPDYPTAVTGDTYNVSVAGRIGGGAGPLVQVGDLVTCINDASTGDHATVGTDWLILERNLDYATETNAGYVQLATQAEANAGTDDTKAITPLKLTTILANYNTDSDFTQDIGNGALTTFVINHALNRSDLQVEIMDNATKQTVYADMFITDANNTTVTFNDAPSSNAYKVIIKA